jgi:glycosyltransferase A (GT-A) superfamily protein (DUF2064 family)
MPGAGAKVWRLPAKAAAISAFACAALSPPVRRAEDGGFWLVGARRAPRLPPLFQRVRWSSPHALADTLAGLPPWVSVGFVDRLEDVDDGEAYRRLMPRRGF